MSSAYKCDKCGEFSEGEPCRRRWRRYGSSGFTGWTDSHTIYSAELCLDCAEDIDEMLADILRNGEQ